MSRLINPRDISVYLLLLIKHLNLFWLFLFLWSIFVTNFFLGLYPREISLWNSIPCLICLIPFHIFFLPTSILLNIVIYNIKAQKERTSGPNIQAQRLIIKEDTTTAQLKPKSKGHVKPQQHVKTQTHKGHVLEPSLPSPTRGSTPETNWLSTETYRAITTIKEIHNSFNNIHHHRLIYVFRERQSTNRDLIQKTSSHQTHKNLFITQIGNLQGTYDAMQL